MPTSEQLAVSERPTPREFPAVRTGFTEPASQPPHTLDSRAVNANVEAEVRLLAMRVAILVRRVEELGAENESLRTEMSALRTRFASESARSRPSAPYSSVAPTSEVVRLPDSKRSDPALPVARPQK